MITYILTGSPKQTGTNKNYFFNSFNEAVKASNQLYKYTIIRMVNKNNIKKYNLILAETKSVNLEYMKKCLNDFKKLKLTIN